MRLPGEVAGSSTRLHVRIQTLLLRSFIIGEAEIVRDGLEHIEPDCAFLALEVTWLEFDSIERASSAA